LVEDNVVVFNEGKILELRVITIIIGYYVLWLE
jgi:hypothetical protein